MRRRCRYIAFFTLICCWLGCSKSEVSPDDRRAEMVRSQIAARGITDRRVLAAYSAVPRERFVLPRYRDRAYDDLEVPFGHGETLDRPYESALMVAALALTPSDRVLHIGTGAGYAPAILSRLAKEVYTIEIVPEIARDADARLRALGYDNVHLRVGDGYLGWPEHAPFDAILFATSPPRIPAPLVEQLAEGGRMLLPLGGSERFQELVLFRKQDGNLVEQKRLAPTTFSPMKGKIVE